jgi:hypothetical protein
LSATGLKEGTGGSGMETPRFFWRAIINQYPPV